MKKETLFFTLIMVLAILIISGLVYYLFFRNVDSTNTNSCVSLGCSENEFLVGSINSDKYYSCDCSTAKRIKLDNIICFVDEDEAKQLKYIKGNC